MKKALDGLSIVRVAVPYLDKAVVRVPPVVVKPEPEAAVFSFNWLSATGTEPSARGDRLGPRPPSFTRDPARSLRPDPPGGCEPRCSPSPRCWPLATPRAIRAPTPAWASPSRAPASCSRSSLRSSAGWALPSPAQTRRRTFSSETCRPSPPSRSAFRRCCARPRNASGGVMGKMIDAQSIVVASVATGDAARSGRHPALCVLPQPGPCLPGWSAGPAAGLRLSVDGARILGAGVVPARWWEGARKRRKVAWQGGPEARVDLAAG